MRRMLALLLAAVMVCGMFTGCGLIGNDGSGRRVYDTDHEDREESSDREDRETETPPETTEAPVDRNELAYGVFKETFYANYQATDLVYLADVTHDGVDDMVVVAFDADGFTIYGYVYVLTAEGSAEMIYAKQGSTVHAGGFFSWFLRETPEGYHNLGEEGLGMWQGAGILSFTEYYLTESGYEMVIDEVSVNTDTPGTTNEYGMITDEAYYGYKEKLNAMIRNFSVLYQAATESDRSFSQIDTDPASVFSR